MGFLPRLRQSPVARTASFIAFCLVAAIGVNQRTTPAEGEALLGYLPQRNGVFSWSVTAAQDEPQRMEEMAAAQAEQPNHEKASEPGVPSGGSAPTSGQSSTDSYPTLTADQMRDMAIRSDDIAFMVRLMQMRQNAAQLSTAASIGQTTDLKFFVQLNNCDNPQINRLLDNEFEYPKIAAYYMQRVPDALSRIPDTISYWLNVSLGQYDPSQKSFRVDPQPRIIQIDGIGYPDCKVFGGLPLTRTQEGFVIRSHGNVDRYVVVPFQLTRLPMDEDAAQRYVDSLPNPAHRQMALKFTIQITPGSVSCKSQKQVREEIEAAARGEANASFRAWINTMPGLVNAPEDRKWASENAYVEQQADAMQNAQDQWQSARNECIYAGPLVGEVEVAARQGGPILASFDPNPSKALESYRNRKPLDAIAGRILEARFKLAQQDYDQAAQGFQSVLADDPNNEDARAGLDAVARARARSRQQSAFLQQLGAEGIWFDPATRLMWSMKKSEHALNWQEAQDYCRGLSLGGLSGWGVPFFQQLQGIYDLSVDETKKSPEPEKSTFRHLKGPIDASGHNVLIWSNSGGENWNTQAAYSFESGSEVDAPWGMKSGTHALCVRQFQPTKDGVNSPQPGMSQNTAP